MGARVAVLCAVALLGMVGAVAPAVAAAPSFPHDCSVAFDEPSCERLDYIVQEEYNVDLTTTATETDTEAVAVGIWAVGGITFGLWLFRPLAREMREWGAGM